MKIQDSLEKLAQNLPPGYIIMPDSCILAGDRKEINLLTGKVKKRHEAQRIVH